MKRIKTYPDPEHCIKQIGILKEWQMCLCYTYKSSGFNFIGFKIWVLILAFYDFTFYKSILIRFWSWCFCWQPVFKLRLNIFVTNTIKFCWLSLWNLSVFEWYLYSPEGHMIESSCERDNIWRYCHFVLLDPGAGEQFLGGNQLEDWKILESKLTS